MYFTNPAILIERESYYQELNASSKTCIFLDTLWLALYSKIAISETKKPKIEMIEKKIKTNGIVLLFSP